MATYVALLRGINVGGRHRLPMRDLVRIFEESGCVDVATYIQSGNVIFDAPAALAMKVPGLVVGAIEREFGFSSPVVLRTKSALSRVLNSNPLIGASDDPKLLMVAFLDRKPSAAQVRSLEPERFTPDRLEVQGSEVYLHYPGGAARSKLTAVYLDRRLGGVCTARNWNTVTKLVELCEAR